MKRLESRGELVGRQGAAAGVGEQRVQLAVQPLLVEIVQGMRILVCQTVAGVNMWGQVGTTSPGVGSAVERRVGDGMWVRALRRYVAERGTVES